MRLAQPQVAPTAFPSLLLGTALMVWGYSIELLPLALLLALAFELAPVVPWRWRFSDRDFHRLVDLSALLFVVVAVYQFDQRRVHGVYGILQWLPGLLALLLLAERYSVRGAIPLSALFLRVRRAVARGEADSARSVHFVYPYFVACLISASAGVFASTQFFALVSLLVLWALHWARPRGVALWRWLLLVMLVVAIGYGLQHGIKATRKALEPLVMEFMRDYMASIRDPFRSHTAIGDVGDLKTSEAIELRVHVAQGTPVPGLLHEATFRQFSRNTWLVGKQQMQALTPSNGGLDWLLSGSDESQAEAKDSTVEATADATTGRTTGAQIRISRHMPSGRGLVAVPVGATAITKLGVETLSRHELGTLKVGRGPEFVSYEVDYGQQSDGVIAPSGADLGVPKAYRATLAKWLAANGVPSTTASTGRARQTALGIVRGLADGYAYSIRLPSRIRPLPLKDFLEETRSGHCEFYATATVLLLRAAGVPARYVTGYAVHEWSPLEDAFVVRRRHAHAWASAYLDGAWRDLDTTPANWAADEAEGAPWWGDLYAAAAWLRYLYASWRWRTTEEDDDSQPWLLWAALPLIGYLVWRLRAERVRRGGEAASASSEPEPQWSPLLPVLRHLQEVGHDRRPGETPAALLRRLRRQHPHYELSDIVTTAVPLHERLRFSTEGLNAVAYETLEQVCSSWLKNAKTHEINKVCAKY